MFHFLVGNADAHAKNISLLHGDEGVRLAPLYDIARRRALLVGRVIDTATALRGKSQAEGWYDEIIDVITRRAEAAGR